MPKELTGDMGSIIHLCTSCAHSTDARSLARPLMEELSWFLPCLFATFAPITGCLEGRIKGEEQMPVYVHVCPIGCETEASLEEEGGGKFSIYIKFQVVRMIWPRAHELLK